MLSLYRWFLDLYPSAYRREYADEMISVFRDAHTDASVLNLGRRISFCAREVGGLLLGAVHEHIHVITGRYPSISFRRYDMRPEFRFPRSTVVLMSIILAAVLLAMEKAKAIHVKYAGGVDSIWPSLPWLLGLILLCTCATAAATWGILFALRRTGTHRLANIQPCANRPE